MNITHVQFFVVKNIGHMSRTSARNEGWTMKHLMLRRLVSSIPDCTRRPNKRLQKQTALYLKHSPSMLQGGLEPQWNQSSQS